MDTEPTLFLDMDGVLADFDRRAEEVLGMDGHLFSYRFGDEEMWRRLNAVEDFFFSFPPMEDAHLLWEATRGVPRKVLTALPKTNQRKVDIQKRRWISHHFGADNVPVITCLTREKPRFAKPGDILVDDRNINEAAWKLRGGIFIHHDDAQSSVAELRELGVIE